MKKNNNNNVVFGCFLGNVSGGNGVKQLVNDMNTNLANRVKSFGDDEEKCRDSLLKTLNFRKKADPYFYDTLIKIIKNLNLNEALVYKSDDSVGFNVKYNIDGQGTNDLGSAVASIQEKGFLDDMHSTIMYLDFGDESEEEIIDIKGLSLKDF